MLNTNIFHETVVNFSDGLKRLKRPGKTGCGYHLLHRWAHKGVFNRHPSTNGCGARITLEYMRVGGFPVTSVEAFERFHLRCSGVNVQSPVNRKKPKGTR